MSSTLLLKLALPLIGTHGFTREALARSVLSLPAGEAHPEPLSDTAVSALFGRGKLARKTLILAWLDAGLQSIQSAPPGSTIKQVLRSRLKYNEPALHHLPEAFALLASSSQGLLLLDPRPAFQHAARIADEACYAAGDTSLHLAWYRQRGSLAAIYAAAELHQLKSPETAYNFMDTLLDGSSLLQTSLDEANLYASYFVNSWTGIIKSSGII